MKVECWKKDEQWMKVKQWMHVTQWMTELFKTELKLNSERELNSQ